MSAWHEELWRRDEDEEEYKYKVEEEKTQIASMLGFCIEWFNDTGVENDYDVLKKCAEQIRMAGKEHEPNVYESAHLEAYVKEKAGERKLSVLAITDEAGFTQEVLDEMAENGRITGKPRCIPAKGLTDSMLDSMLSKGPYDLLIFGAGVDVPQEPSDIAAVFPEQMRVINLYMSLCQKLQKKSGTAKKMAVLTADAWSNEGKVHKEVGLPLVTHAGLWGYTNTVRLELQSLPILCLDVPYYYCDGDRLVPRVAAELCRDIGFGEDTVRLNQSGRFVARFVRTEVYQEANVPFVVPDTGVIFITGGNGSLAMIMGNMLLDKLEAAGTLAGATLSIKFLSRSCKIEDSNKANWAQVERRVKGTGVSVEQVSCDFSDADAVDALVARHDGVVSGIIHAAGVLRDALLQNQTKEKNDDVFVSKVKSAYNLHAALEKRPSPGLAFFWLFSSTGMYGNPGATNYSAANACLDGLARHRRATGKPCLAINWGGWGEVGMAANLTAMQKKRINDAAMPLFSTRDGLAGLANGLQTGLPTFTVQPLNGEAIFKLIVNAEDLYTPGQGKATTANYMKNLYAELASSEAMSTLDLFRRKVREECAPELDCLVYEHFIAEYCSLDETSPNDEACAARARLANVQGAALQKGKSAVTV